MNGGPRDLRDWVQWVNQPQTLKEPEASRLLVRKGVPYGEFDWQQSTIRDLGLESSIRRPGRPKKEPQWTVKRYNRKAHPVFPSLGQKLGVWGWADSQVFIENDRQLPMTTSAHWRLSLLNSPKRLLTLYPSSQRSLAAIHATIIDPAAIVTGRIS